MYEYPKTTQNDAPHDIAKISFLCRKRIGPPKAHTESADFGPWLNASSSAEIS